MNTFFDQDTEGDAPSPAEEQPAAISDEAPATEAEATDDAAASEGSTTDDQSPDKIQRRMDKLTAKRREAEERADRLEAELAKLREAEQEREDRKFAGLPVLRDSLRPSEQKEYTAALEEAKAAKFDSDFWFEHIQDGWTDQNGREWSGKQCAEQYRRATNALAKAEATVGAIEKVSRDRLREHLRKTGFRVEAEAEPKVEPKKREERKPQVRPAVPAQVAPKAASASVEGSGQPTAVKITDGKAAKDWFNEF